MAIDAEIPLGVRPFQAPQVPNLIDQYAKVQGIKNVQQETELRRQEGIQNAAKAQREQQQYDEGTRKLAGDKALGEQLAQNTSTDQQGQPVTDYQSAAKNLAAAGFGDHARQVLVMGAADQKAKLEDHGKTLDNTKKTVDAIGAALGSLSKIPPDQYAAQRDNKIDELVSQGTLTPQQGQQYKSSTVLAQSQANGGPGDVSVLQQFDQAHLQNALTGQQQIEAQRGDVELGIKVAESKQKLLEGKLKTTQEITQNTASLLSAATNQAQWEGILKSQVNAGAPQEILSLFGPMYSPAAAQQAGQLAMKPSERETARHNVVEEAGQAAQRATAAGELGVKQGELKLKQQQAGFEQGGGISETAKAAAAGDLDPATVRSMLRKNPGLIEQIKRVDPNFDEASLDNRYNTLKEFTNTSVSKAGGQALALNTLIHHAELYKETAEALKNGSFKPGNAVYNAVATAFGSAPPTQADLVARFFASETGKVASGGVPAEGEINGILKGLSSSNSPDQIAKSANSLLQIAAGRATPLMERAKAAKIDNVVQVLGPDAKAILAKNGFDPNTMKPVAGASAGSIPTPSSQAEFNALPKGAQFMKPNDSTVYTKK